jgi:hypothetical protein
MESKPVLSEVPRLIKSFPCFVRGCRKEARHLTRIRDGVAVVQLCLCDDCRNKCPESILHGLTVQPKKTLH